jgi:hypothetical protein
MNVLIASTDAVFARMLELEFLERGVSCVTAGTQAETDVAASIKLAVIDAKLLLSGAFRPPSQCELVVCGYPEELGRLSTQELTRYYAVVRPFVVEDFFSSLLVPAGDAPHHELRTQKRKNPAQYIALDETQRAAYYKGEKIELTKREFDLLRLLLDNRGKPVSRKDALSRIFGEAGEDTNVVDVYINYLRSKIDNRFRIRLISTVRGFGYMISD